jgi:exodeoxyribonuclease VII small subunit
MEKISTFEQAIARLEAIVDIMEKGDVPLEEALKLYQEGQLLLKSCQAKLDEAEKKLKILAKNSSGETTLKDSPEPDNSDVKPEKPF